MPSTRRMLVPSGPAAPLRLCGPAAPGWERRPGPGTGSLLWFHGEWPSLFHGSPAVLGLYTLVVLPVGGKQPRVLSRRQHSGAFLPDLPTDALDSHRSFQDKHGLAGKRELEPEDEARPGERTLIPGRAGQWGYWPPTTPNPQPSLSWAAQNLSAARTRHPKPESKILGRPQGLRACPALGGREGRPSDAPRCPGLGRAPGRHPCPLWFLGSFDRPLAENNVVRTIIEFLTFLHLKGT